MKLLKMAKAKEVNTRQANEENRLTKNFYTMDNPLPSGNTGESTLTPTWRTKTPWADTLATTPRPCKPAEDLKAVPRAAFSRNFRHLDLFLMISTHGFIDVVLSSCANKRHTGQSS